jgi:hypothetical protein
MTSRSATAVWLESYEFQPKKSNNTVHAGTRRQMLARERAFCQTGFSDRLKNNEIRMQRANLLTKLWGVGRWTADMAGVFYFEDAAVFCQYRA